MIYLPEYNTNNCVEVIDKDTIRVFDNESTDFYTDYYINSHYLSKTGQVEIDYVKNCSQEVFTTDMLYSNDLPYVFFISICFIAFLILPCLVLWRAFYKRSR